MTKPAAKQEPPEGMLTKEQAAERLGKSTRALEGYQKQGLIKPAATGARSTNYYSITDVDALKVKLDHMKEERETITPTVEREAPQRTAQAQAAASIVSSIATTIIQSTGKVALNLDEIVALTSLPKSRIEQEVREGYLPSLLSRGVLALASDLPVWLEGLKRRQGETRLLLSEQRRAKLLKE